MEQTPCTCGGENERCFRCDGTGFYAARIPGTSDAPDPTGARPARDPRKQAAAPRRLYVCQRCGKSMPESAADGHRCAGLFAKWLVADSAPAEALTRCPECGQPVRRLSRHIRRAHPGPSEPALGRGGRAAWGTASPLDRHTAPSETHHDATRGWGRTYRDNGQFGSHPSYDDLGEEGEP